ncbi:MAG: hypothetical protein ACI8WB_003488 [Phenylobacterium sp.]|jgi:hypothetical protein
MSTSDQDPLDKKLSRLYQQRKQQLQMPDKEKLVPPSAQQPKQKPLWSSRPVWGSTITACFIMVISFYFMPNDLVPLNDGVSDDDNKLVYSADTGYEVQHQPNALMPSSDTATMAQQGAMPQSALQSRRANLASDASNRRAKQSRQDTQRMSRAELAKVEIVEAQIAGVQAAPEMAAAAPLIPPSQLQSKTTEIIKADSFKPQRNAYDGANPEKQVTDNSTPPTIARLLTDKEKGKDRQSALLYSQDCDGKIIAMAPKWLIGIDDNQWVEVHYDNHGKINKVSLLKDFVGCDNER